MVAVLLILVALAVSYVVVQFGGVAFEMTGLERRRALFQSLSCFSTTGFTTRESEMIVNHPQRRKIAMILMILGNAGLITVISGVVVSITAGGSTDQLRNIVIMLAGLVVLVAVLRSGRVAAGLRSAIWKRLHDTVHLDATSDIEVLTHTAGYGVARLHVASDSALVDRKLRESGLRQQDIMVLAIERGGAAIPLPTADRAIHAEDFLICFGLLQRIQRYGSHEPAGQPTRPAD